MYAKMLSCLIVLAAVASGCQSSGRVKEGEKSVESFQSVQSRLEKSQGEVDKVLASLNELSTGAKLESTYKDYVKNVAALKSSGDAAKKRADAMRENFDAYVARWQSEMETIQDPAIKSSLELRKQAVRTNFDDVRDAGQEVKNAYEPFMQHLDDIQKALAIDLSQGQVQGLKSSFSKARENGANLKQKITSLQNELKEIYSATSPAGSAS